MEEVKGGWIHVGFGQGRLGDFMSVDVVAGVVRCEDEFVRLVIGIVIVAIVLIVVGRALPFGGVQLRHVAPADVKVSGGDLGGGTFEDQLLERKAGSAKKHV